MAHDFLFELGCEELPPASVYSLSLALTDNIASLLDKEGLLYGEVSTFSTPRRLAVIIKDLQEEKASQRIHRRGPALRSAYTPEGKATPALIGFAKSCGVGLNELVIQKTDKGEWITYEVYYPSVKVKELLPGLVQEAVKQLPTVKTMRWGEGNLEFIRPIHWVLMLLDNEVIPARIFGIEAGRYSYGHRFHHPQAIEIEHPHSYERKLQEAFVIADFGRRKSIIMDKVEVISKKYHADAIMPQNLLDEITAIVEWPCALFASFDPKFLNVPPEALVAAMQVHQKCFALRDASGELLPRFITVANIESLDPSQVILGNEKVMQARLSDAAFFFEKDKKKALKDYIPETKKVIFQAKLGTLFHKAERIKLLLQHFIEPLSLDREQAHRAAELSKCDLLTDMVNEFPELQGIMGDYYACHDKEPVEVALALREQYIPRFAGDHLPTSSLGKALSLSDRLDTLLGIFAIGEKPTGDKDPFKLRRHALAIARLLLSIPAKLELNQLIEAASTAFDSQLGCKIELTTIKSFIFERLQSYYQSQGKGADLFLAVKARQDNWLYDFDKRMEALARFTLREEASGLAIASKRVTNLLKQITSLDKGKIDESLLEEGAEKSLFFHLLSIKEALAPCYEKGDYVAVLTHLAALHEPVDAFFDQVMIMVENESIKHNRLQLLVSLNEVLQGVADISLLKFSELTSSSP